VDETALTPGLIALASTRAPAKPYLDVVGGALVPLATPAPEPPPPRPPAAAGPLAWSALYRFVVGLPRDTADTWGWPPGPAVPTDRARGRPRGPRGLRAVLAAPRDETAKAGAPPALVLGPPPRVPPFGEDTPNARVLAAARELGIPAINLSLDFYA